MAGEIIQPQETVWLPETFREYLLAIARDKRFLLPLAGYPQELLLAPSWHELFGVMRERSSLNNLEYYAAIGVSLINRSLILQTDPSPGDAREVPGGIGDRQKGRLLALTNAEVVLGDAHSHPVRVHWEYGGLTGMTQPDGKYAAFSGHDLLRMIGLRPDLLNVLVAGFETLVVVRTSESYIMDSLPYMLFSRNPDKFTDYWCKRRSIKYDAKTRSVKGDKPDGLWQVNLDICDAHRLAIYKSRNGGSFRLANRIKK